jgi:hypothetical protein
VSKWDVTACGGAAGLPLPLRFGRVCDKPLSSFSDASA